VIASLVAAPQVEGRYLPEVAAWLDNGCVYLHYFTTSLVKGCCW
jgi:hypothetical protein